MKKLKNEVIDPFIMEIKKNITTNTIATVQLIFTHSPSILMKGVTISILELEIITINLDTYTIGPLNSNFPDSLFIKYSPQPENFNKIKYIRKICSADYNYLLSVIEDKFNTPIAELFATHIDYV